MKCWPITLFFSGYSSIDWSDLLTTSDQIREGDSGTGRPVKLREGAARSRSSVTQKALERIQDMIRSEAFPRGEPLPPQRRLAEDLNVSRASLREALSILGTLGILRIEQGRGTFVASVGDDAEAKADGHALWRFTARFSLEEVYQFRAVAEPAAAALAAMQAVDEEIRQLEENLRSFKEATREMDLVASSQIDFEFHRLIMVFSRNRMLLGIHGTYRHIMLESQRLPLVQRSRLWEPIAEHERILEAIRIHDPDGARYYMRLHISRAADRVAVKLFDLG